MSSDLEDFEEQITELIQGIQQVLDREIPSLKGEERTQKCHYLKNRLNRARQVHRSIVVEIRGLIMEMLKEAQLKKNMDEMTSVEMTKQALLIQDKTQESTARTQRILDETIQVGVTVQTELKQQGEKIRQVDEDVERIESNLRRADKQMRVFVRRMGNDKIFMFMILLMVVGIIIAIVFTVLKKKCPTAVQGILCSAPTATS
ncbi:hypothetical protein MT418_006785 [Batrachochytrium dendrobatidis]